MTQHIYIYSPSGAVRDKAAFRRGLKTLKNMGYEVEVDEAALASHTRFAGDDDTRLAAIRRAAASGAKVALISRGGYGITRLLDRLPYKAVAKAIDKGTHFVGLSDFTAFQNAVLAQTGRITWAGPALCEGFGPAEGPDDIMQACFEDLMLGQGEGTGWRQHRDPLLASAPDATKNGAETSINTRAKGQKDHFKLNDATLWGGNLAVLTSMLGTPYFPNIKGGVLCLEDVGEHPYRIERMLSQLLYAGVLKSQKAIVLGQFTEFKLTPHDKGFKLQSVVDWLRSQTRVPVLTNLPFGHVPTKVLLPVGAKVDLLVEGRDVLTVWGHDAFHGTHHREDSHSAEHAH